MKKIIPVVLCWMVLGCASELEIKQRGYEKEISASDIVCTKTYAAADLGSLKGKINRTKEPPTLALLTNNTYVTEEDKPYIELLDKLSRACWKSEYDITLKYFNHEHAAVIKDISAALSQNRADLYNGKITFGEYNKAIPGIHSKADQRISALNEKLMNQAMQEKQQVINALRLYHPIPYNAQMPQRNNVYCNTFGNNTNCTSY